MASFVELCLVMLASVAPVIGASATPVLPSVPAAAAGISPALEGRVAAAIAARWSVEPGALRLTWSGTPVVAPEDDAPFRISGAGLDGRFAVVIRPGGPDTEALRVRAGVDDTVAVAARALAPGTRLSDSDLALELRTRWGAPRSGVERPAAGWEVRRPLAAGESLAWPAVVAPALITSGEPVRLLWTRGDVKVSMSGVALNSARLGETVRARVDGRTLRVLAIAIAPGTASLTDGGAR